LKRKREREKQRRREKRKKVPFQTEKKREQVEKKMHRSKQLMTGKENTTKLGGKLKEVLRGGKKQKKHKRQLEERKATVIERSVE